MRATLIDMLQLVIPGECPFLLVPKEATNAEVFRAQKLSTAAIRPSISDIVAKGGLPMVKRTAPAPATRIVPDQALFDPFREPCFDGRAVRARQADFSCLGQCL